MRETEAQLEVIRIQGLVHKHVRGAVKGAIDDTAERQLALEVYDNPSLRGKTALATVLHEKLGWLLEHKAMGALDVVDLLTLLGPDSRGREGGVGGGGVPLCAFGAECCWTDGGGGVEVGGAGRVEEVYVEDDWAAINDTDAKSDEEVRWRPLRNPLPPPHLHPLLPLHHHPTLDTRYSSLDSGVRAPLLSDLSSEDSTLRNYMTHARLGKWFEGALDLAKRSVEEEKRGEGGGREGVEGCGGEVEGD
ncbi:hypothetical protein VC83_03664 [Pseudogymnoascus destructans]|uniref:Nucleoporin Nup133/Nup155-like C-terminal domain-containing protein n=1 Tax=Pseudogymnoascus destructans TaxID=655981 RepID=A0A177AE96_9PEZI|nr:uncharacterized protein VC83_03664 [Pseudogymnoascus destructans]OAF59591.1 hypothetical protein VC83_03664 [Pseudogymnoascus destructans]